MTNRTVTGMLDASFTKSLSNLSQELRLIAEAYISNWDAMSPAQRRARAEEVDRQRATKSRIKLDRVRREHERLKNDPIWVAKDFVAWYDEELDAAAWYSLGSISPREAAMLLCHFNPHDDALNPLDVINDETNPEDFKRLLRAFEDVALGDVQMRRTLSHWYDIARAKGYKFHSWIATYESARALVGLPALAPDEATMQGAPRTDTQAKWWLQYEPMNMAKKIAQRMREDGDLVAKGKDAGKVSAVRIYKEIADEITATEKRRAEKRGERTRGISYKPIEKYLRQHGFNPNSLEVPTKNK